VVAAADVAVAGIAEAVEEADKTVFVVDTALVCSVAVPWDRWEYLRSLEDCIQLVGGFAAEDCAGPEDTHYLMCVVQEVRSQSAYVHMWEREREPSPWRRLLLQQALAAETELVGLMGGAEWLET